MNSMENFKRNLFLLFFVFILITGAIYYYQKSTTNMKTDNTRINEDVQIELGLKAINSNVKVKINNHLVMSVEPISISDEPNGGSIVLINEDSETLKDPEVINDKSYSLIKDSALLQKGENNLRIEYTSLSGADYSRISVRILELNKLAVDIPENKKVIYQLTEDTKAEGVIEHKFMLPYTGEPVIIGN